MRKLFNSLLLLILFLSLLGVDPSVRAQSGASLRLYSLQTVAYPAMTAGLDVFDSAGNFVTGLTPGAITLLEDDQPRQVDTLEETQPGVQFALAFDPSPAFAYRDARAVTRYDKVEQILLDWAAAHPDSLGDDLNLIPTGGTPSTHLASAAAFAEALTAFSPILREAVPSLSTLSQALDAVTATAPQPGMKRAVLFVTSVPTSDALPTLESLTQRAANAQVRVFVWIVDSQETFTTTEADALVALANQTGGQYIQFSGEEPLPGLETYLAPLRHTYRLTYTSGLMAAGGHTLKAQVSLNGETISSASLPFELNVQPPNPILVDPPDQIVRQAPDSHTTALSAFVPARQAIDIIIEFPDQRTRTLIRTTLYVDGQRVAENAAEPFDHFTWDLTSYTVSGEHRLSVEVVDIYGLSKTSLEVPVTITVIQPQRGLLPFLSHNSTWVVAGALVLAGAVLGFVLAWGRGRRRSPSAEGEAEGGRAGKRSADDPLTQPVVAEKAKHGLRLPWSRPVKQSEAYLLRLKDDGQPVTSPPIPVITPEMIFGSDPIQANRVLDDASVSPLHARLKQENGEYFLSDEKTVAGTWVNYEPLTAPRILRHGDVIHIGRICYRFMLRKPPELPDPTITRIKQ